MIFSVFLPPPPVFPAYGRKKGGSARHSSTGEAALVFSSAPFEMLNPERKPAPPEYFCTFEFIVCNTPLSKPARPVSASPAARNRELGNLEKRVGEDDGGFR